MYFDAKNNKQKNCHRRIKYLTLLKYPLEMKEKDFLEKQKLRQYIITRSAL
jgi:hypothetical protein